jgi:hypothetical protein
MKKLHGILSANANGAIYLKFQPGLGFAQSTRIRDQLRQELRCERVFLWTQGTGELDPLCSIEMAGHQIEVFSGRTFTHVEGRS